MSTQLGDRVDLSFKYFAKMSVQMYKYHCSHRYVSMNKADSVNTGTPSTTAYKIWKMNDQNI